MDLLDEIFDKATTNPKIFLNREALRSDYVPDKLPFREQQLTSLAQTLTPLLQGSRCSNLLLYGKTGTGKTVAARYVLNKLMEKSEEYAKSIGAKGIELSTAKDNLSAQSLYEKIGYIRDNEFYSYSYEI